MLRLFTGLMLPEVLRKRLVSMQGGIPGARWTSLENFHVTLNFIGDCDEGAAEDVDEALSTVHSPQFVLGLSGTGSFSQGEWARVLWMGVHAGAPLSHLKDKIDRALEGRHLPVENRRYVPHVTMANLKQVDELKVAHFMQEYNLFRSIPFEARDFHLFNSVRTKNGPAYEVLKSYPLSDG